MKRLISIATVTAMILVTSLANGKENSTKLLVTVVPQQIATKSVQAHAKHKRVAKSKIQRAQPFGIDDDDDDFDQIDDLATGYRRRDLAKIEHDDGISQRVRWRLFLARQLAMMKYRELHG
jgi:hypothetical protein